MKFRVTEKKFANSNIKKYLVDWDTMVRRGKNFGKRQFEVKQFLKGYWKNHIVLEEFILPRSNGKSIDIFNTSLWQAVEIDGLQHIGYSPHFHRNSRVNYYNQKLRDHQKEEFCKLNGISLIRIFPADEISYDSFIEKGLKL